MARWAGWGAGPAGAGAARPSRVFLGIALAASVGVALAMIVHGNWAGAVIATVAAGYFIARLRGLGETR